ncbi:pyrimidine utilization protein D [Aureimonas flava]|uniref:Putative carbamate hydrolase RutD n=1 Tax=Aureimonas flava TaxID=2320271 RepID=A0A3A1WS08_9HYPH|nr:pyrimidine utilization protein D [Aureimonas flava]RIY03475.1 pyrimidine utilization protein D [Aureimonas flava]
MSLHHEIQGRCDDAPTIVLSSGLGGAGAYWAPQIEALASHFRVVTYDHRGTNRSGGVAAGGISAMADDVLEVAAAAGLGRFHFMGHALGGLIGLDLALRADSPVESLVLVNAWGRADAQSGRCFDTRITLLREAGVEAFVRAQPLFLYPGAWMAENHQRVEAEVAHAIAHFQGRENVLSRIAALRAFDVEARLGEIAVPTLVVAARDDLLVPYTRSLALAEAMPQAALALSDFGAHAVNITEAAWFNAALRSFLTETGKAPPP